MRKKIRLMILIILSQSFINGCVSHVYKPGKVENPLNKLQLGQTYSEMVKVLGEPDRSYSESRMAEEMIIVFIPVWNLAEWLGDFNPSTTQLYTYENWGAVMVDNNNQIIRIEAK